MHARLAEIAEHTESVRASTLRSLDGIPADRWGARSTTGKWTAAQLLDHLHLVERSCVRTMRKALDRARTAGLEAETSTESLLHSLDQYHVVFGDRPMEAPEFVTPRNDPPTDELLANLRDSRQGLMAIAHDADGLALGSVIAMHARLGAINLYQWFLFVAKHEVRHLPQLHRALGIDEDQS